MTEPRADAIASDYHPPMHPRCRLSVVTSLFCSAPYVREFVERAAAAAREFCGGDDFEIVLVNDGSPDDGLAIARSLVPEQPRLVVVDLSRNFGHYKALITGLEHATGEYVFLIDSDLEEQPEWLLEFQQVMARTTCDVVVGAQAQRRGGMVERWSGGLFYRLFNLIAGLDLPPNVVTARLMTRRFVLAFLRHRERETALAPLMCVTGYAQVVHAVEKRATSPSTYTFGKKVAVLVEAVTSFSNKPLRWIFYTGVAILVLAVAYTAYLLARRLLFGTVLAGWTSVMASIWILGGLIICFLGIIGIYLSRIFMEVKRRPLTVVRDIYAGSPERGQAAADAARANTRS